MCDPKTRATGTAMSAVCTRGRGGRPQDNNERLRQGHRGSGNLGLSSFCSPVLRADTLGISNERDSFWRTRRLGPLRPATNTPNCAPCAPGDIWSLAKLCALTLRFSPAFRIYFPVKY